MKLNLIKKSTIDFFLPSSEKNNFIYFFMKFNFIDFFPKYNQKCHEKRMSNPKYCSVKCFDFYRF